MERELAPQKRTQIVDPNPKRKKRLMEKLLAYVDDRISLADLQGISGEQLNGLAELGFVKLKHGRLEEAESLFQGLLMLDHRNAYFHASMGAIHQKRGRPVEAIMEYTMSLRLNKKDVSSRVNRGEIYLRHKNYKKAAEDFRAAILLDNVGINLWANRARSLVIALKRSIESDQKNATRQYSYLRKKKKT